MGVLEQVDNAARCKCTLTSGTTVRLAINTAPQVSWQHSWLANYEMRDSMQRGGLTLPRGRLMAKRGLQAEMLQWWRLGWTHAPSAPEFRHLAWELSLAAPDIVGHVLLLVGAREAAEKKRGFRAQAAAAAPRASRVPKREQSRERRRAEDRSRQGQTAGAAQRALQGERGLTSLAVASDVHQAVV